MRKHDDLGINKSELGNLGLDKDLFKTDTSDSNINTGLNTTGLNTGQGLAQLQPKQMQPQQREEFESFNPTTFPSQPLQGMNQQTNQQTTQAISQIQNKEFELISAKLDAIKAELQVINQRLILLERASNIEEKRYYNW